jgi:O-antigen ligase
LTNSGERDNEIIAFAKHFNVGGFSFVYTIVLLIPICVYLLRNKLFNRIVVIAAMVPMIMMVLSAGFTTAILFTTLSAVLFLLPKQFTLNKILIWMILGLVVFSLMGEVIGNGFITISNSVESRLVSDRLYDIGATLKGETISAGDFDSRQTLWKMDMDLFFEHPFFGASRSGGHSFILDELSEHGLVGLCFLLVQFITIFKMFVKPYKKSKAYGYICFVFFMQIGLSFLNPVMSQIVFVTIIPLTLYIFEGFRVIRD